MSQRFSGKTIVITGACRGIGAGIAERFAQEGANLVLASNDLERVTFTADQLAREYSVDTLALGIDVTNEEDIEKLYREGHARFGSIDVSVQNAGIITIDAFDREIIAWTAVANAGISGSDVRDMMLEAVEKRFVATRAPHAIEHLSDNGSAYTARDTRLFAQALNLTPCFTPVASPQSNGMSEAFVKTLKRDYIRISALPDAETALRLIDGWIEDYNEIHPHSALKMASPRQFIRAKSN